jgi:curli production assembly/transport component CsgG
MVGSSAAATAFLRLLTAAGTLMSIGCASTISPEPTSDVASLAYQPYQKLLDLPPPESKVAVALYRYDDKTGQFKPSETVQTLSRAVTQGASSILVQALQNAGRGNWFTVVERESLKDLLTERKIISEMRNTYLSPDGKKLPPLGPMLYAGIIFEGGIVGFDTNTLSGGLGARYLGIGGNAEYRQDTVTVYLRAISTKNGAILKSVMATKKILSYLVRADVFKFIDFAELLEVEAGYTTNEPGMFALKKAIEKAVYLMVMNGAEDNLWSFRDPAEGRKALQAFREEEHDGMNPGARSATAEQSAAPSPQAATRANGQAVPVRPAAGVKGRPASGGDLTAPAAGATVQRPPASQPVPSRPAAPVVSAAAAPGAPTRPDTYLVQLASMQSESGVREVWSKLNRAHPDLFNGVRPAVAKKNLGRDMGTWYRLVVGPFGSSAAAGDFCSRVRQRKLACGVMRHRAGSGAGRP